MNKNLKEIGKSVYGTKYAFAGIVPLDSIDLSELKWGDVIKDNDGNGRTVYVNNCNSCCENFLGSTLILIPEDCNSCYNKSRFADYNEYE